MGGRHDAGRKNDGMPDGFVKGKGSLYFHHVIVPGVDMATFRVLLPEADRFNFYGKDQRQAYFFNSYGAKPKIKIIRSKGIDSFERLDAVFARDGQFVYYKGTKLKQADPLSFVEVGMGYWKDRAHVYHHNHLLEEADAASFILIGGNHYATDRENVYCYGALSNKSKNNPQETEVQDFVRRHGHLKDYWWTRQSQG